MHVVDVDQSGKLADTKVNTVLAFSNGVQLTVLIPAQVKRDCVTHLRGEGRSPAKFYMRLFATGLYFLLKDYIDRIDAVTIDIEYEGNDGSIKEHLLNLLRRNGYEVRSEQIGFGFIGKKSGAHEAAIAVFRGEAQPNLVLTFEDLMQEFRAKKRNRGFP